MSITGLRVHLGRLNLAYPLLGKRTMSSYSNQLPKENYNPKVFLLITGLAATAMYLRFRRSKTFHEFQQDNADQKDLNTAKASSSAPKSVSGVVITTPETPMAEENKQTLISDSNNLDEHSEQGAFNPDTGEINWDCPCLGGMAQGPCGEEFKAAFSCFVYSENEPKGIECVEKFQDMQTCFRAHPDVYGSAIEGDNDETNSSGSEPIINSSEFVDQENTDSRQENAEIGGENIDARQANTKNNLENTDIRQEKTESGRENIDARQVITENDRENSEIRENLENDRKSTDIQESIGYN